MRACHARSAENLRLAPGDKLAAFFKPSDVVLAAD
jgi:molybdopterin-binding protein